MLNITWKKRRLVRIQRPATVFLDETIADQVCVHPHLATLRTVVPNAPHVVTDVLATITIRQRKLPDRRLEGAGDLLRSSSDCRIAVHTCLNDDVSSVVFHDEVIVTLQHNEIIRVMQIVRIDTTLGRISFKFTTITAGVINSRCRIMLLEWSIRPRSSNIKRQVIKLV